MGEFGWQMGFVVIVTLIFINRRAFILPLTLLTLKHDKKTKKNKISLFFNSIINTFRDKYYKPLLSLFLKRIYIGYLFFIGLFIVFVFLSGVKFTFFPSVELDDLYVGLKLNLVQLLKKQKYMVMNY